MLKNTTICIHGFDEGKFNYFLGRLLTQADALGLEENQREAYKAIIKQEVWSLWEHPKFIEDKESIIENVSEGK